jgi:hypothetical protein
MVKVILILIVIAILMEDGSSIRKTEDERREEEEIAKAVNATLAKEEAERKKEEDERKKRLDLEKKKNETQKKDETKKKKPEKEGKTEDSGLDEGKEGKDEALPSCNLTCPIVEPCPKPKECPAPVVCEECPEAKECGPCPTVQPCKPCPGNNSTVDQDSPSPPSCMEPASMSVPEAMAIGAMAGLLVTGLATTIGLLLRYVSPIVSGFIFVATIIIVWYLCSHHPEAAREIGGRVVETLRAATATLSHRVVAALQRHHDQVGLPVKLYSPLYNEFHVLFKKVCTKIFYVRKINFL